MSVFTKQILRLKSSTLLQLAVIALKKNYKNEFLITLCQFHCDTRKNRKNGSNRGNERTTRPKVRKKSNDSEKEATCNERDTKESRGVVRNEGEGKGRKKIQKRDKERWKRKEQVDDTDKFYCVSFRLLHLSALFRAGPASCPCFLISRRPLSRKKPRQWCTPALKNRYSTERTTRNEIMQCLRVAKIRGYVSQHLMNVNAILLKAMFTN